jgi:hydrogenase maturation protease
LAPARSGPPETLDLTLDPSAPIASPLAWPHPSERPAELDRPPTDPSSRILVGGVGYTNLRDRSFGPLLIERLRQRTWPPDVVVDDLSFGPIDVLFKLQAEPRPFKLGIFVGAVARGRPVGAVERYEWGASTLSVDELQARVGEAVTGIVSLDNLVHILAHFRALPHRTVLIEVEPETEEHWGSELSGPVAEAVAQVEALIVQDVHDILERHPA